MTTTDLMENPWSRQPDEPTAAFARFDTFRLLGPDRNLARFVHAQARSGPDAPTGRALGALARTHSWIVRAQAYDASLRAIEAAQLQAARLHDRQERMDSLKAARAKVIEACEGINPADLSPKEAVNLLIALNKEIRDEYGDTVASRHEVAVLHVSADDFAAAKQTTARADLDLWTATNGADGALAALVPPTPTNDEDT